jgi:hypothetical protein
LADVICETLEFYGLTDYRARIDGGKHGKVEVMIGTRRCVFVFQRRFGGSKCQDPRTERNTLTDVRKTIRRYDPERAKQVEAASSRKVAAKRANGASARAMEKKKQPPPPPKEKNGFDLQAAVMARIDSQAIALEDLISEFLKTAPTTEERIRRGQKIFEAVCKDIVPT